MPRPAGAAAFVERARKSPTRPRTHAWAERCLEAHRRPDQALFGIIQGGLEADLRAESARAIGRCRSTGCVGGLAGDESGQRAAALDVAMPLLPTTRGRAT